MREYMLERKQVIPRPVAELFPFFEKPENLALITPPWLRFNLVTASPVVMKNGAIIDYTIRWFGIPVRWRTRIATYLPPDMFVDEQIKGPYAFWRHTHTFVATGRGTEMTDVVRYRLPGGIAGRIVRALLVRRQLEVIFDYRAHTIARIFSPVPIQRDVQTIMAVQ